MFKNIVRAFLLFLLASFVGNIYATNLPDLKEGDKKEVKGDSLTVNKDKILIKEDSKKNELLTSKDNSKTELFNQEEEVEEDSTSNSALSFNFIYYIIEKFKLQVE